jgi:hypothetical protein
VIIETVEDRDKCTEGYTTGERQQNDTIDKETGMKGHTQTMVL